MFIVENIKEREIKCLTAGEMVPGGCLIDPVTFWEESLNQSHDINIHDISRLVSCQTDAVDHNLDAASSFSLMKGSGASLMDCCS